jgi:hypothetical protein
VAYKNDTNTPSNDEYGDMVTAERPAEEDEEEAIDNYFNVELIMNMGTNDERCGRVIKRSQGLDGEPIGCAHNNPLFDMRKYEVKFADDMVHTRNTRQMLLRKTCTLKLMTKEMNSYS